MVPQAEGGLGRMERWTTQAYPKDCIEESVEKKLKEKDQSTL